MFKTRGPLGLVVLAALAWGAHLVHANGIAPPASHTAGRARVGFLIVVHTGGQWAGEARFPRSAVPPTAEDPTGARQRREAAALFDERGIHYDRPRANDATGPLDSAGVDLFTLRGRDTGEVVDLALGVGQRMEWFEGPVVLDLEGIVHRGQVLALALPANPATGYAWDTLPHPNGLLARANDDEIYQTQPGLGAPARQVLRFEARETGPGRLSLVYRRPWEADREPGLRVSVQPGDDAGDLATVFAALGAPIPPSSLAITATEPEPPPGDQGQASIPRPSSALSLPVTFNWCEENGGCTPIKNQGSCGSCWAFASVGPLEAHLQAVSTTTDLSEQYLLSCNTNGWDCDGGWFAHDYHIDRIPPGEPEAGAVLESAFPYQADTVPCGGPYDHPYKILSWSYVEDVTSVPPVADVQQAIYDHGPVGVAMCVGTEFGRYDGGIFETNESCPTSVNHAVVLVGWNDADQVWIMRNSWGPSWGEEGTMRIRYGTSLVGYGANYITHDFTPPPPFNPSSWAYVPLALRNYETPPWLLNGDFENGRDGAWSETSVNRPYLIVDSAELPEPIVPHGGDWIAWLGGDDLETSTLAQRITVPDEATTLDYWYWIDSQDVCGFDYAYVRFGSTALQTYDLCADQNTSGWVLEQIDVTGWQGQIVELTFVAETDWLWSSSFFLDDVSFSLPPP